MIILGLVNPYPGDALAPHRMGSAGHRLFKMSGLSQREYEAIDRRNLLMREDEFRSMEEAALCFRDSLPTGSQVLLLGEEVRRAISSIHPAPGLPRVLVHPATLGGVTYRQIPHPSGRVLFYNDPVNRAIVEVLFRCLTKNDSLMSDAELTEIFGRAPPSPSRSRS